MPHACCHRGDGLRTRQMVLLGILIALACVLPSAAVADEADEPAHVGLGESLVREAAEYGWRNWVRQRVLRPADDERFGLTLDEGWQKRDSALPIVVLVHGFNSTPQRNDAVLEPIREAGFPCAGFSYPNDHSLGESAARLSRALKDLAATNAERRVVLVTHSMGGLVARACVEDPALDPGNVSRLIQIAPPTHGTLLAHAAVATDVWEHWLGRNAGGAWTRWRDSVVDGLGEAADDLVPGSQFLTALNARPRNPQVSYSILLGTAATVSEGEMDWLRTAVSKTGGRMPGLRTAPGKPGKILSGMGEMGEGKGDGVVAVKRGRLEGVDDVTVLAFGHLTCTGGECEDGDCVRREVLARVQ